jgi:hypothetical protein
MRFNYPEDYTDLDKATYDNLISQGRQLIGVKMSEKDSYILDLAAKITINQSKGFSNNLSQEEIQEIKDSSEVKVNKVHYTPADLYVDGYRVTEDGTKIPNPLLKTDEECYAERIKPPDDDKTTIEFITNKVDEMLEIN